MSHELVQARDQMVAEASIVELSELELLLVGGGIGETILATPSK